MMSDKVPYQILVTNTGIITEGWATHTHENFSKNIAWQNITHHDLS